MKAIIFDFDGTLADSGECGRAATKAAFAVLDLPMPTDTQIDYYMGIPIEQSFREMSNNVLNEQQFAELLTAFRDIYKQLEFTALKIFPEIDTLLETLQAEGWQLFVLSSKKTSVLERNLQSLQLDYYITEAVGSDQVTHYKPHPAGIFHIAERYQLQPSDCIMIGDATFDIDMGNAAGCQTIAVAWGSHSPAELKKAKPTFLAYDVPKLLAYLQSLPRT